MVAYGQLQEIVGENPLRVREDDTKEYLRAVFEFHLRHTPYWRRLAGRIKPDLDEVFQGKLEDVFTNILNSRLIVDEDYLRANWLDFVPDNYHGRIRFYQSSGTTRERAIGHWDANYLGVLLPYLKSALDEIYGLSKLYEGHQMRAIAHGPYGWYQEEISELVWGYGGVLYFIGMETDGLKRVLREQGLEAVLRLLDPLVKYTHKVMKGDRINTVRSAPPLMRLFEPYAELIETAIVSGVGINPDFVGYMREKFPSTRIIPLYGYYLFGDLVGIYRKGEFRYYPNYPTTVIFPVKKENGEIKIVKRGERGKSAFLIARPEVLVVKIENETAKRVPPDGPFGWDGFADPLRV